MGRGISFPSVSRKQIEELAIPLPPLPEQHRIVAKVDEGRKGVRISVHDLLRSPRSCRLVNFEHILPIRDFDPRFFPNNFATQLQLPPQVHRAEFCFITPA